MSSEEEEQQIAGASMSQPTMEEDEFHSLNKGVFVIPFNPASDEPGPSRRPLAKVYDFAADALATAYENYESERAREQIDDIADWLDRCAAVPLLNQSFPIHRLPVALMQGISSGVNDLFPSLPATVATVAGREIQDLASATRAVAVGFLGEAALAAKKTGRTPLDEVERWAAGGKDSALLIVVEQAQAASLSVLSELVYVLTRHTAVPFRLLLSAATIQTFLSSWTFVEPSEVELSILSSTRTRKRGDAVNAILDVAQDPGATPFPISDAVAEELKNEEELIGGGAAAALRSLKWLLLKHSMTTPLATLEVDEEHTNSDSKSELPGKVQALATVFRGGEAGPASVFKVMDSDGLVSAQNPAPRRSILAAMSKSAAFLPKEGSGADAGSPPEDTLGTQVNSIVTPFQELEAMNALWQASGKAVSLWDWLEGFRHAMAGDSEDKNEPSSPSSKPESGKRKRPGSPDEVELDEDEEARLHARFIRYVEESRMMGLVRARGGKNTAKKGDEVLKGVLMI